MATLAGTEGWADKLDQFILNPDKHMSPSQMSNR